jgi:hypothetical protein
MTSSQELGKIILPVENNPSYGRCEIGADVRGYPRPNATCVKRERALKKLVATVATLAVVLIGAAPALAQGVPVAIHGESESLGLLGNQASGILECST